MQENDYSDEIARHYAAYRPDLHSRILGQCLGENTTYKNGVDIGCGAGHSAIALTRFCGEVIGMEPNLEMLGAAIDHPRVRYVYLEGSNLPLPSESADLITFAGSWFYAQSQDMLNEVNRICSPEGRVIVYDFSIDLKPFWSRLRITVPNDLAYDHSINFDGLDPGGLVKTTQEQTKFSLTVSSQNLAHLLLAEKFVLESLRMDMGSRIDIADTLCQMLNHSSREHDLHATIFYTMYKN